MVNYKPTFPPAVVLPASWGAFKIYPIILGVKIGHSASQLSLLNSFTAGAGGQLLGNIKDVFNEAFKFLAMFDLVSSLALVKAANKLQQSNNSIVFRFGK